MENLIHILDQRFEWWKLAKGIYGGRSCHKLSVRLTPGGTDYRHITQGVDDTLEDLVLRAMMAQHFAKSEARIGAK